jgi:hypothetical protein
MNPPGTGTFAHPHYLSILVLRGHKVILDADLAKLFGVTTRRINEQVRRNRTRFPSDFLFELTAEEIKNLKSHFATSRWGGRRKPPFAFTEHGAIRAATILNSPRAIEVSVYVSPSTTKPSSPSLPPSVSSCAHHSRISEGSVSLPILVASASEVSAV